MKLIEVYSEPKARAVLYRLLQERKPWQSISHKTMPTWEQHCAFFESRPYEAWYLIEDSNEFVGATYLTKQREVGIFIFDDYAGNHYGEMALKNLLELHPGPALANVAPYNGQSHSLFQRLGGKVIQHTYLIGA